VYILELDEVKGISLLLYLLMVRMKLKLIMLKVLPYMSWFPYDSMRKVVCIAGRQYARQAGGDLVYITQLPHQT
jgi:hypothetical protein